MIKELIITPIIGLFLITFMLQLADTAGSVSAKVINFTDDMENAFDCAYAGVSIYNCSPKLASYNFQNDAREYKNSTEEYLQELLSELENATVIEGNGTLTIIYD